MSAPTETALDFAGLLELLGYAAGEHVSVCYEDAVGKFHASVGTPAGAPGHAAGLPDTASVYFGVNPVKRPRRNAGRGKESDVTRLAALVADLDVKPGGCGSLDIARAIIAELSTILGTRPSAIVDSGHGLHPYWPIEDGQTSGDITSARALLRRWGRLVEHIAGNHNAHADNVFDLTRVLRLPGSYNNKSVGNGSIPILVTARLDTGGPLSVAEVDERLTEVGVEERDGDREVASTEVVSPPDGWKFANHDSPIPSCDYVVKMINGWSTDRPKPGGGRNPFVYSRYIRLYSAYRSGCITGADFDRARQTLADLLTELVSTTEPRRKVRRLEFADFNKHAIRNVATKTDEQVRAELGDHHRNDKAAGAKGKVDDPRPKLWRADQLKPAVQPHWLAKNRLPRGAVSLLIGDEGIGKSLLWVLIVATVTTGKALPEFGIPARAPGHVIVAAITEDDWQTVVRPRLEVAGADLTRIRVICTDDDGSGAPTFPRDLALITGADPKPDLVVVDAWLDTVPANLQVKDPQQARQALHPWKDAATALDAALLLLCHTNRVGTANARDRYGATGALRQKARMTLFAQTDKDGRLVVGPEKANSAAATTATLFTIDKVQHFAPTVDDDGVVPLLRCVGETTKTARQILADTYAATHDTAGSGDAVGWLAVFLAGGPQLAADAYDAGEAAGYSKDKLRTARRKLNVSVSHAAPNAPWYWALPQHTGGPTDGPTEPSLSTLPSVPSVENPPKTDGRSQTTDGTSTCKDVQRGNRQRRPTCFPPVGEQSDPSHHGSAPPNTPSRCPNCDAMHKINPCFPGCQQTTTEGTP